MSESRDEQVLILLPRQKMGQRSKEFLDSAGITCVVCRDLAELCDEVRRGAGARLLTEEAFSI